MMKPFSHLNLSKEERIFNYRLSRARRVVENVFGILVTRFRVLINTMQQNTENVQKIVMACICLHNLMRMRYPQGQNWALDCLDANMNVIPGAWRQRQVLQEVDQVAGGTLPS